MEVTDSPANALSGSDHHLVDQIVTALQTRISNGDLPVGGWLRQERIARDLGVSRMPVREALRQLQALGAVEIIANRGARVAMPSMRDVIEVYEVRGVLESHAAASAARLITSAQLQRLQLAHDLFVQLSAQGSEENSSSAESDRRPLWHTANTQFHTTLIEASGNRHLVEMIENLHRKIPRNLTWLGLEDDTRRLSRNADEHGEILRAISAGDSDEARRLVMQHAENAADSLVRVLDEANRQR
jgi:DNA-binding GntR family transcriptional regulator